MDCDGGSSLQRNQDCIEPEIVKDQGTASIRMTPVEDSKALIDIRSAGMEEIKMEADISLTKDAKTKESVIEAGSALSSETEITAGIKVEALTDTQMCDTEGCKFDSGLQKCDSSFRPVTGSGKFMYVDVSQLDKQYVCDECGDSFAESVTLAEHTRIHAEEHAVSFKHSGSYTGMLEQGRSLNSNPFLDAEEAENFGSETESHGQPDFVIKMEPLLESESETQTAAADSESWTERENMEDITVTDTTKHWDAVAEERQISTEDASCSCNICDVSFSNLESLAIHIKAHRPGNEFDRRGRPYSCEKCHAFFSHHSTSKQHIPVHARERPYACKACGVIFVKLNHITDMNSHILTKSHSVKTTQHAVSNGTADLSRTVQEEQLAEGSEYSIQINHSVEFESDVETEGKVRVPTTSCQAENSDLTVKLRQAIERRAAEKQAVQNELAMEDTTIVKVEPLSVLHHVDGASGEGDTITPKMVSRQRNATEEKRFSCTVCGASFKQSGSLNEHMRVHTGERPYPCVHCGLRFKRSTHLKCHIQRRHKLLEADPAPVPTKNLQKQAIDKKHDQAPSNLASREDKFVMEAGCSIKRESVSESDTDTETERMQNRVAKEVSTGPDAKAEHAEDKNILNEQSSDTDTECSTTWKQTDLLNESYGGSLGKPCGLDMGLSESFGVNTDEMLYLCEQCEACFKSTTSLKIHTLVKHGKETRHSVPDVIGSQAERLRSPEMFAAEPTTGENSTEAAYKIKKEPSSETADIRTETKYERHTNFSSEDRVRNSTADKKKRKRIDNGRRFFCTECGATFKQSGSLNEHMRVHTGERPFPCSQCEASFKRSTHLRTHMQRVHATVDSKNATENNYIHTDGKVLPFQCPECDTSFMYPSELAIHVRMHTGERPFKCKECQATFARSGNMRAHMRIIHTRLRPFTCTVCHDTFTHASRLKSHTLRKHTPGSLLQFHCPECDASFVYRSEFRKHQQSHLLNKPFPCNKCSATFSHVGGLNAHVLRRHSSRLSLPFPCLDCDASFMSHGELKRHSRVHTGEKPFPCSECSETFAQSGTLKRHVIRKHSDGELRELKSAC